MTAKSLATHCLPLLLVMSTAATGATADVLSATRISQTLGVLAAIVGGIFALAYIVRRMPGVGARAGGALKLVDALSIGTRERILLVEVDGERLVIAVSPGRIEHLHVLGRASARAPTFAVALANAAAPEGHA